MKVDLDQVKLRGAAVSIQQERVVLITTFNCNMSGALARKLGVFDALYIKGGGGSPPKLRLFTLHALTFGFEDADLELFQDMQMSATTLNATVKKFAVVQDEDGAKLKFSIYCDIDDASMVYYVKNQKKEVAPKFVITGRQKEIAFAETGEDDNTKEPAQAELPTMEVTA